MYSDVRTIPRACSSCTSGMSSAVCFERLLLVMIGTGRRVAFRDHLGGLGLCNRRKFLASRHKDVVLVLQLKVISWRHCPSGARCVPAAEGRTVAATISRIGRVRSRHGAIGFEEAAGGVLFEEGGTGGNDDEVEFKTGKHAAGKQRNREPIAGLSGFFLPAHPCVPFETSFCQK
ncbi:hypothetical protein VUR80DRAFT_5684 [Thermomyces stellatus]